MKEKKNIVDELNKRQKPEVPKGFFENFYTELMAKIAETASDDAEESVLDSFNKTTKPDVPAEFFSSFAQNINQPSLPAGRQTKEEQPTKQVKPARIIDMKLAGIITAAAACLLVMFLVIPSSPDSGTADNDLPDTQTPVETEFSDDDLLAFVDSDDIIDYILDEEIEIMTNTTEEVENNTTTETSTETSNLDFEDLDDEDILFYLEEDMDDIYLDDLEL